MKSFRHAILEQAAGWDRPTRIAMTVALILLVGMFAGLAFGGDTLRLPSIVGIVTLMLTMQGIALWGNRRMVTPYTQAQRHYLAGEFQSAQHILETQRQSQNATLRELTLLGNTYRQLGMLDESQSVLYEALDISPDHHFPLYGFGRTLMAKGDYQQAAAYIQCALNAGAPPVVVGDLAEAYYRVGDTESTQQALDGIDEHIHNVPHRQLMTTYIRYRLNMKADPLPTWERDGLAYWQESARRFAHTPYGQALAQDVSEIQSLIEGD